jgi:hypothetical protein
MEKVELDVCVEEEKKKCLKNLQQFYKKYGCEKIESLRTYLSSLYETITDDNEKEELKKQLELLDHYS